MKLYHTILLIVVTICFMQCRSGPNYQEVNRVAEGNQAILTGKIDGNEITQPVTIQVLRSNTQHELKPGKDGQLADTLSFRQPSYIKLVHQGQSAYGFLKPGDSLHFNFKSHKLTTSLTYSGNRPEPNNYLVAKQRFSDTIGPQSRREEHEKYTQKPEAFAQSIDSLMNQYQSFYQAFFQDQLPSETFHKLEQANIQYHFYRQKQLYPNNYRRLTTGRYPDLSEEFKGYKDKVSLNQARLFAVPSYQRYLRSIVNRRAQQRIEENQDKARTVIVKNVVESTIPNDTLKARVLGRFLLQSLKTNGPNSVQGVLAYYRQLPHSKGMMKRMDQYLERWKRIAKGQSAPDFAYPSFEGDTVRLANLRGSYVYIDAWATWCGPCIKEIPHLKTLQQQYKPEQVRFVSISLDKASDEAKWREFVKKRELKGLQLFANGKAFQAEFAKDYLINSIPRFILIGPEGRIIDPNAPRPSQDISLRLDNLLSKKK